MAIRLEPPPIRGLVDKEGNATPEFTRWLQLLYKKTGAAEPVLPVSLGGTGGASAVEAIAVQTGTSGTTTTGTTSTTQRKTFTLDSPVSLDLGDFITTVCTWDTPFADASYQLTYDAELIHGSIEVSNQTASGFSVKLTNTTQGRFATGELDSIGVHA